MAGDELTALRELVGRLRDRISELEMLLENQAQDGDEGQARMDALVQDHPERVLEFPYEVGGIAESVRQIAQWLDHNPRRGLLGMVLKPGIVIAVVQDDTLEP